MNLMNNTIQYNTMRVCAMCNLQCAYNMKKKRTHTKTIQIKGEKNKRKLSTHTHRAIVFHNKQKCMGKQVLDKVNREKNLLQSLCNVHLFYMSFLMFLIFFNKQ